MSRICGMESRVHHSVKSTFDLLSAKKCIVRDGLKPLYGRARKFPPADSPVRSFGPVNGSQVSDERAAGIAIPFPSYIPQFIALIIGNSLPDRRRAPTEARNFLGARTNGAGATIAIPSISRRSSPRRELPLAADIPPRWQRDKPDHGRQWRIYGGLSRCSATRTYRNRHQSGRKSGASFPEKRRRLPCRGGGEFSNSDTRRRNRILLLTRERALLRQVN